MNSPYRIFLGSKSPRRQQLLRELGLPFALISAEHEESYPDTLKAREVAAYLAQKKAESLLPHAANDAVIITSDTVVVCEEQVLGKPENEQEAVAMLRLLSGREHRVISGVSILKGKELYTFDDTARVFFRKLEDEEIQHYVHTHRPFDKAGAYGIQEWIGMVGIEKLEGSFYTVMGLPVHKLYQRLLSLGIIRL